MSTAMWWMVIGIVLIVVELMITSVIAVFFGIAAIVTALLLQFGVIESLAMQYTVFAVVSIAALFFARGRLANWFKGHSKGGNVEKPSFQNDIGERVTVVDDFQRGAGKVILNGVRWNALSTEDLMAGETVWVIANEGIQLTVARDRFSTPLQH